MASSTNILLGTLDVLILKSLTLEPLHGLGVARRVEQITGSAFQVKTGSLFPALHRMEEAGWLTSSDGISENNRKARYYRLTAAGRRQLGEEVGEWRRIAAAMTLALRSS
jgi:PadR family transcriptional regulator, regulatory protein PadR